MYTYGNCHDKTSCSFTKINPSFKNKEKNHYHLLWKKSTKNALLRCLAGSDEGIDIVCDNTNLASMAVGLSQLNTK